MSRIYGKAVSLSRKIDRRYGGMLFDTLERQPGKKKPESKGSRRMNGLRYQLKLHTASDHMVLVSKKPQRERTLSLAEK